MPAKKKPIVEADTASAPKKRTAKKASATPAKKKAPAKSTSAAATHKAPARRILKAVAAPYVFDVEAHREEIAHEAYFLWLNRSCGPGHEHEDWLRAIEIVRSRRSASSR